MAKIRQEMTEGRPGESRMLVKDDHIILEMRRQNIGQKMAEYWKHGRRVEESNAVEIGTLLISLYAHNNNG
jgi:hypothetical protein